MWPGIEVGFEACQRRFDQQRSVRRRSFPSPQPSPLGGGRLLGGTARSRERAWLERRACFLPLPEGEGWGEGEARIGPAMTRKNEPGTLEFWVEFGGLGQESPRSDVTVSAFTKDL